MKSLSLAVSLLFILGLGFSVVQAEEEDKLSNGTLTEGKPEESDSTSKNQQLSEVVVEGRSESLIGIAESSAQGKVGQNELETRPILRSTEILESVPGLVITQHSGDGKANQYYLRGFNLDHGTDFRTTVDEMPVNMPTHGHGQGYTDLNFLIPELVQAIEYKKGVYYAEEGDFSSAGAANISLVDTLPKGMLQGTVGEDNFGRTLVANSVQLDAGNLLYATELGYYDGPWDLEQKAKKYNALLRFSSGSKQSGFNLTAMAYGNTWNSTDQIPDRAVDSGLISDLGNLDPTDGGRTARYSLSAAWHEQKGDSTIKASLYAIYYRLNLFSNFTFFLDDPIHGDQFEQVDRRTIIGGQASYEKLHKVFDFDATTTVGFQLRNDIIPTVALRKTEAREEISTVREDEVVESSIGSYLKNEIVWTDKFRSTLGVRGDVFIFDVDSNIEENSGNEVDGKVSPKAGIVFGPWADTELYLNGGLGFHSNDARGTTITIDPGTGEQAEKVDPLVLTKGAEVGVRSAVVPGLNSSISLWILELDSELLFVGDAGITEPNRGSRRYGVEFANFYKPLPWLMLDADYSISHARFTEDAEEGDYIPGAIESVLAAGVTLEQPEGGALASLRARYFGPRPLIEDDSVRTAETLLLNSRVGYKYKNLKFTLDILNLLDSDDHDIDYFYASRLPGEDEGGIEDIHYHPVEPRQFRGTLTWYF